MFMSRVVFQVDLFLLTMPVLHKRSSATDKRTGTKVAIKKIPKLFNDLVDGKRILREMVLLRQLRHDNVIGILDIMSLPDPKNFKDVYIVTQLMDTDLYHVIRSKQKLTTEHIQFFTYQILRGLKYIHSARVLHRDLVSVVNGAFKHELSLTLEDEFRNQVTYW